MGWKVGQEVIFCQFGRYVEDRQYPATITKVGRIVEILAEGKESTE